MSYKGHQFEKWMTPEEWALFETNYKNNYGGRISFKTFLSDFNNTGNHPPSFYEFVSSAFMWHETEEDTKFWEEIADREQPLNEEELHD